MASSIAGGEGGFLDAFLQHEHLLPKAHAELVGPSLFLVLDAASHERFLEPVVFGHHQGVRMYGRQHREEQYRVFRAFLEVRRRVFQLLDNRGDHVLSHLDLILREGAKLAEREEQLRFEFRVRLGGIVYPEKTQHHWEVLGDDVARVFIIAKLPDHTGNLCQDLLLSQVLIRRRQDVDEKRHTTFAHDDRPVVRGFREVHEQVQRVKPELVVLG
mmetsp:Transcript_8346/g.21225  ORF Transcript_8346/g.21225 Transcript_8346/m.21225 type:complete len:215 (+) Transcript_8346:81-725(+)